MPNGYDPNQSKAQMYAQMMMNMSQQPNQAGAIGGLSNAAGMMIAALGQKRADQKVEAKHTAMADALAKALGEQVNPIQVTPAGGVQDGFDYSGGAAMGPAGAQTIQDRVMSSKNTDLINALGPEFAKNRMDTEQAATNRQADIAASWQKPQSASPGESILRDGKPVFTAPFAPKPPTTAGGMYQDQNGSWSEIPGYREQQEGIARARRAGAPPAAAPGIINLRLPNGRTQSFRQNDPQIDAALRAGATEIGNERASPTLAGDFLLPLLQKQQRGEELTPGEQKSLDTYQRTGAIEQLINGALVGGQVGMPTYNAGTPAPAPAGPSGGGDYSPPSSPGAQQTHSISQPSPRAAAVVAGAAAAPPPPPSALSGVAGDLDWNPGLRRYRNRNTGQQYDERGTPVR